MARIPGLHIVKMICLIAIWAISQAAMISQSWAQSRVCRQLEQRLSRVSTGNVAAPSRKYRQYENAIQEQRVQLTITKRIARRNGCVNSRSGRSGRCGRLNSSLRQMNTNLAKLQQTRNRLRPTRRNAGAERRNILRTMQQRGCIARSSQTKDANVAPKRPRRRSLMEQIFGRRAFREDGRRLPGQFDEPPDSGRFRSGTFRTMCVRTCDGYYFPISFSTTQDQFAQDADTCQNRCPGSEVALYFHGMPSESPEQMISYRTDLPYAQEPFAFAYRKEIKAECSCNFSQASLSEIAGGESQLFNERPAIKQTITATPTIRQDRFLNPEALSNKFGAFTLADLQILGNPASPKSADKFVANGAKKRIRIVGPAFFPTQ